MGGFVEDSYRASFVNENKGFLMGGFYEVAEQSAYPFVLTKTG